MKDLGEVFENINYSKRRYNEGLIFGIYIGIMISLISFVMLKEFIYPQHLITNNKSK